MLQLSSLDRSLPIFQALSSSLRARMLTLLASSGPLTLKEISDSLQLPASTVNSHMQKLLECQLVYAEPVPSRNSFLYHARAAGQISIDFSASANPCLEFQTEIPVGQYANFSVTAPCGLATVSSFLGRIDEPRYFTHPSHHEAEILWFTTGYIEYFLPNYIHRRSLVDSIELSFEIASEAPQYNNDWPSDITFMLNKSVLGTWTSPGDFGDVRGLFTPSWWFQNWNQYGLLKMLVINRRGTYIDGLKISDVNTTQLSLTAQDSLRFRFQVQEPSKRIGGLTLFGQHFGNYNQDIKVQINYSPV